MISPVNHTHSRMYFRLLLCLFLLHGLADARGQAGADTMHCRIHYRYSSITFFSGDAMQFFGRRPGALNISFPYSVSDSSGTTDDRFSGERKDIYGWKKSYVLPILIELGHKHHFVNFGFAFPVNKGGFTGGPWLTTGYGFLWYADPWRRGRSHFEKKRFA